MSISRILIFSCLLKNFFHPIRGHVCLEENLQTGFTDSFVFALKGIIAYRDLNFLKPNLRNFIDDETIELFTN